MDPDFECDTLLHSASSEQYQIVVDVILAKIINDILFGIKHSK